ncbi:RDD family protein [Microlunatus flavus]|uniref:RDD family protein n=1 Tax=Microlunatus flavus TaxID=1036181 RepID=A0A1H9JAK3_9ACTN|nr:RDD family protein [Microlunatus flavus]SEQ83890.1 RDD family protein [Microlunatus flavus]
MDEQGSERQGSERQRFERQRFEELDSRPPAQRHQDAGGRPAPPGYLDAARDPQAQPQVPDAQRRQTTPDPVYGRVTRFGAPADQGAQIGSAPLSGSWPAPYGPPVPGPVPPPYAPAPYAPEPYAPPAPPGPPGDRSAWAYGPAGWGPPPGGWPPPAPRWRREEHASWWNRVGSDVIDRVPAYVGLVFLVVGYLPLYAGLLHGDLTARPTWWALVVGVLLSFAATGWTVYNRWVVAGRTGQSLGKRVTRTWLVGVDDGRPIGVLNAFLRDLLHVVDGIAYVGYLWPLWDEQRQTLADKIIRTVVVRTPVPPLTDRERVTRV